MLFFINMRVGWLIVFLVLAATLAVFAWWVYKLKKPHAGVNCHTHSDWLWSQDCLSFQEKFLDKSLKSPKSLNLVLTDFTSAEGGGPPIQLPMWYRFRYVNVKTGGYSEYSAWTKSPVIAGSCCLPCPGGPGQGCPSLVPQGSVTCNFNQPTIGISSKISQYSPTNPLSDGGFIYINLHRYVGESYSDNNPPPDDAKDEIVGFLAPGNIIDGTRYYEWTDVLFNPCKDKECREPLWCAGPEYDCKNLECLT